MLNIFRKAKNCTAALKAGGSYFLFILIMLSAVTGSVMISSCEKINEPYLPFDSVKPPSDTVKKILIEDYTGHKCQNCPPAAERLHSLEKRYPKQIIGLGVHCTYYAFPDASYPQDFRSDVGNKYVVDFSISGLPNGVINRKKLSGSSYEVTQDKWNGIVDTIVDNAPEIYMEISNTYDAGSRVLVSEVKATFLKSLTGNYNLVLLLTEDSIIAPQLYGNNKIDNYEHTHVLRAGISDNVGSGSPIVTGSVQKGDVKTKPFSYTIPASFNFGGTTNGATSPVIKNCNVVAFIYNASTKEVIQAEKQKIQ